MKIFQREGGIVVCPEQLGGLPTPRKPAYFTGGEGKSVLEGRARVVVIETGEDVTENFIRGAEEVLKLARLAGIKRAYMKEKSPSCGVNRVYIDGNLEDGRGVTSALFEREGIEIIGVE